MKKLQNIVNTRSHRQHDPDAKTTSLQPREGASQSENHPVVAPGRLRAQRPSRNTSRTKSGQKLTRNQSQKPVVQITNSVVNHLKEELLQTWETYLIPDYHRTVFLDCIYGLTPQQYSHLIVKEIEDL